MKHNLAGHLLIASPKMTDPRFDRTVILLLRHDDDGALGVVLNRPLKKPLGLAKVFGIALSVRDQRFHLGGPVSGPIIVLQGVAKGGGENSRGGAFVIEEREQLEQLLKSPDVQLRFFVGHAGWSGGQLESEIADGAWMTMPASEDFVFGNEQEMWVSAVREVGRSFYAEVLGIHHFPENPAEN
jgi:putative transcriptional regulator